MFNFITGRNEVGAKVMFLLMSVILLTGGVCLSTCWEGSPPGKEAVHAGKEAPPLGKEAVHAGKEAHTPRREAPPPYCQWAAGTHPTGMHSCLT